VISLAALAAIAGEMTVGVLIAFIAYKTLFVSRIGTFIDQMVAFRLLDVQLEFVSDIALAEEEPNLDGGAPAGTLKGGIKLRNVRFRYGARDREILSGVSLAIEPGEFVAIAGASGTGKSTLLRLMCGLAEVTSGEVLIDGFPVRKWGQRALRRQIGIVMQDDQLLAGSIAENITLFDSDYRQEDLLEAARLACIEEEIQALPMGFHTLVGDLGNTLSGGQKQRIMIARALYRKPKILVMDEGTSHIDVPTERRINETLKNLEITRIVAAHRPDTLAAADRVFLLAEGQLRLQSRERAEPPRAAPAGAPGRGAAGPGRLPGGRPRVALVDPAPAQTGWKRRTNPAGDQAD
jgi:ATP-binding cassette subfamily B protein RaxB